MKKPVWLDRGVALAIHELMLAQHGGLVGVRDEGLLESGLSKPRNHFAHGRPTVTQMAAAYAAGIIRNHPFLDGNKCTGFMLAATFMELNGMMLTASEESVVQQTLALAAGELKEVDYATWLKDNSRKARDR